MWKRKILTIGLLSRPNYPMIRMNRFSKKNMPSAALSCCLFPGDILPLPDPVSNEVSPFCGVNEQSQSATSLQSSDYDTRLRLGQRQNLSDMRNPI